MSFLKKLLGNVPEDPLAHSTLERSSRTDAEVRTPIDAARIVLPSIGAQLQDEDWVDEIIESRTWLRVDGATTERYQVGEDGDVTVNIAVVVPTHVAGPGCLEATWTRDVDDPAFAADEDETSPFTSIVDAACTEGVSALNAALGPVSSDDNSFFTFDLSPTGHTSLTMYFSDLGEEVSSRFVDDLPEVLPVLRELARNARATAIAKQDELFAWHGGEPSFTVPTDAADYLERARATFDAIPGARSKPSEAADCAAWSWTDSSETVAHGDVHVNATSGRVELTTGTSAAELGDDSVYIAWTRDPASGTWERDDLYDDEPLTHAHLDPLEPQLEMLLEQLEAHHVYEFSIGTDSTDALALMTSIDVGAESLEHAKAVHQALRERLTALRG